MSFIEGIGDEVVLFFIIVFVFALAALITLVGSVPPSGTTTTVQITRYEYEQNSSEQRENSEVSVTTNSTVRLRHSDGIPVNNLQTSSFIIEETTDESNDNEDPTSNYVHVHATAEGIENLRTEADGSSLADTTEDLRTEADGSAELSAGNAVANHILEAAQSSEEQDETLQPGQIHVRLKYLNDTERIVTTNSSTKIGDFKKKHFQDTIRENKIVRLIFAGRLLQDHSTVENCRILDNSVVHVQILPAQSMQSSQPASQDTDLDVGRLLVPAVTVLLSMCWVLYSKYPEFFSTLSLGVLGTLSCFFLVYVVRSRR